jgi:hypothetical protein
VGESGHKGCGKLTAQPGLVTFSTRSKRSFSVRCRFAKSTRGRRYRWFYDSPWLPYRSPWKRRSWSPRCRSIRQRGRSTSISGPAGPAVGASGSGHNRTNGTIVTAISPCDGTQPRQGRAAPASDMYRPPLGTARLCRCPGLPRCAISTPAEFEITQPKL